MSDTKTEARGQRQQKLGTVVSVAMQKTVVVAVDKTITHRLYHRYQKRSSKFYAHDETNQCRVGDTVVLEASRPLSRLKRWRVREVVKRAGEK